MAAAAGTEAASALLDAAGVTTQEQGVSMSRLVDEVLLMRLCSAISTYVPMLTALLYFFNLIRHLIIWVEDRRRLWTQKSLPIMRVPFPVVRNCLRVSSFQWAGVFFLSPMLYIQWRAYAILLVFLSNFHYSRSRQVLATTTCAGSATGRSRRA